MSNLSGIFGGGFDANQVEPSTGYELLPKGKYLTIITESEVKQTKDGSGQYIKLVHEVIDGQYKGRKVFSNLNIVNRNKTAEEIAHRTLSSLCRATGVMQLQDSTQLHNIPVIADVSIDKQGQNNQIGSYASANGAQPVGKPQAGYAQHAGSQPSNASAAASRSNAAPAGATPPWRR